jgi:hypothetical protein
VRLPSAAFEYPIASETFKRTHNEIRALLCCFVVILLVGLGSRFACAATIVESDVCIYGGTSGGAIAAVQSTRMGKTVSLAVFSTHLGGMTSGGLGQTDVGNTASIGGVSREFYRRIGQRYGMTERFTFEPHVARSVFDDWLAEVGVTPRWQQRLASVTKSGQRITEIKMEDGTIYRAKMFIDATYEGDLMAMAGVSFTFGREGTNVYGESLNGIHSSAAAHQFSVNVDPYLVPGIPGSGLLPFIQSGDGGTVGAGDQRIQAYNYRLCFTQTATNRLPHVVPTGYDTNRYELLGRLLDARIANGDTLTVGSFFNVSTMPNGKSDWNNNGAFSSDYIGMNWTYPTNTYAIRSQMDQEHLEYTQGLIYYLATSPRSPSSLRTALLGWGPCKDEFQASSGYSPQLYVREARRMVSDYVMTQADCQSTRVAPDSICLGSYNMDSHNCQRVVQSGFARNEGDVQSASPVPYPISYRSIIPRVGECENLFVPFAISASHMGFGSTRMEPVFMMTAQSAATAAAFAIDDGVPAQQVNYAKLALQLIANSQILNWGDTSQSGITLDNADTNAFPIGSWISSTSVAGYYGSDYIHDDNTNKGTKSVSFKPNLASAGTYQVSLRWTTNPNRATNAPVDIIHAAGTNTFIVDMTQNNGTWIPLLTTNFNAGTNGSLRIRTTGTSGYVIADAVRWVSTSSSNLPPVQIIASEPVAVRGGKDASLLFIRSAPTNAGAITVQYQLSGTASNGLDFSPLSGNLTLPTGALFTNIAIHPVSNSIPQGEKLLNVTIIPGANYTVGALSNATVRIVETPFDTWRLGYFTAAELAQPAISGTNADPDSDGASNWQEFLAGTDPRDPMSALKVTMNAQAGNAMIRFLAASNHGYTLQYRDSLTVGSWLDLTNLGVAATNRAIIYTDSFSPSISAQRFYRVRAP